jgi:hypothetical protein
VRNVAVVTSNIGAAVGSPKKSEEGIVIREMTGCDGFEPIQGRVRGVQIDGDDLGGIAMGERVAAARGDCD